MKRDLMLASVAVELAAAAPGLAQAPGAPQYEVEFLGSTLFSHAINNLGDCVGMASPPYGISTPWVSLKGAPLQMLPLPAGMETGEAHDINDQRQIVGQVGFASAPGSFAVSWTPNASGGFDVQMLGTIPGFPESIARCIDDDGVIVGSAWAPSGAGRMVLFSPTGNIDLSLAYGMSSTPYDLDDHGLVATTTKNLDLNTGLLNWNPVFTRALNEQGQFAGSIPNSPQNSHAVRWTPGVGTESLTIISTPFTVSHGMNESGDVVFQPNAVHLDGLGSFGLHEILRPEDSDWSFGSGYLDMDINDSKQILVDAGNNTLGVYGAVRLTPVTPVSYCTAGTTTSGCNALISAAGTPSLSLPSGFVVTVGALEGDKTGVLFFGTSGQALIPWGVGSSLLCVAPPIHRTGAQSSGGTTGTCQGSLTLGFNVWMTANPGGAPAAGETAFMQGWFRDPPSPDASNLSDALLLHVSP